MLDLFAPRTKTVEPQALMWPDTLYIHMARYDALFPDMNIDNCVGIDISVFINLMVNRVADRPRQRRELSIHAGLTFLLW